MPVSGQDSLTISIDKEIKEAFKTRAKRHGTSATAILKRLIDDYLEGKLDEYLSDLTLAYPTLPHSEDTHLKREIEDALDDALAERMKGVNEAIQRNFADLEAKLGEKLERRLNALEGRLVEQKDVSPPAIDAEVLEGRERLTTKQAFEVARQNGYKGTYKSFRTNNKSDYSSYGVRRVSNAKGGNARNWITIPIERQAMLNFEE